MTIPNKDPEPRLVVIFSGKRKCGKDYTTELLKERLGDQKCCLLRLSGPLKRQYAIEHGLDWDRLMDASEYKEKYRTDMILWGEAKRNADPGFFAEIVVRETQSQAHVPPVWVVVDARRPTDIEYFKERFPCLLVRVECPHDVRAQRGWVFTPGVDDVDSECALDGREWDMTIVNDGDAAKFGTQFSQLMARIEGAL